MEAAFRSENAMRIVYAQQPKPPRPATEPDLSKEEFVQQVIEPQGRNRLTRDQINDRYDDYKTKWERYNDWETKDGKPFNIIRRHLGNEAWMACEKLWYPKLKDTINYRSWRKDMEAAFRSENATRIVYGHQQKPQRPATEPDLLKEEFIEQVIQPGRNRLNRDQINDRYDDYKTKWDRYTDWETKDGKAFNIIRRHLEKGCLSTIEKAVASNEAWVACENAYKTTTVSAVIEQFEKLANLGNRSFRSNTDLTGTVRPRAYRSS